MVRVPAFSLAAALSLGLLAGPGAAAAQSPAAAMSPIPKAWTVSSSRPAPILRVVYNHAPTPLPTGVARTSVERRLRDRALVSSAGLLCGLQPGVEDRGAASARGYDPQGRFLGAKLALAF